MSSAVVLGASMAGLLAAAALVEGYDEVVLVDRDRLPDGPEHRRGTPQSRHLHGLHESGRAAIESLLPGFTEELEEAGAVVLDVLRDVDFFVGGYRFAGSPSEQRGRFASRPLVEDLVRRRVLALPRVRLEQETVGLGLRLDDAGSRVTGLRVSGPDGAERTLDADLLVDASGRSALCTRWLTSDGWPAPHEEVVEVDLRYVSYVLRAPRARATFAATDPGTLFGFGLVPLEEDRWVLTVAGICGVRPPVELSELVAFLGTGPAPHVVALLEGAEPLGPPSTASYPASRRRRYDALRGLPAGLLPLGDSVAGFNPAYGQGMSVAAVEAASLRDLLGRSDLVPAFLEAADRAVRRAWETAVFADLALPQVRGRRTPQSRLAAALTARVCAAASVDARVGEAFLQVAGMVEGPESLLRPRTLLRVAIGARRARRGGPVVPRVPTQAGPVDRAARQHS